MLSLSLHFLGQFILLLLLWFEEVFTTFKLKIELARLLRRWKGCVSLLLNRLLGLLCLDILFLKFRQKSIPRFVGQFWIFGQFALYHELFDVINRVDVFHTVQYNTPYFLQTLICSHCTNSISLHKHITTCE